MPQGKKPAISPRSVRKRVEGGLRARGLSTSISIRIKSVEARYKSEIGKTSPENKALFSKILNDASTKKNWVRWPVLPDNFRIKAAQLFIKLRLAGVEIPKYVVEEIGLERDCKALNKLLELYGIPMQKSLNKWVFV
jgi:hypothetical protein